VNHDLKEDKNILLRMSPKEMHREALTFAGSQSRDI